MLKKLIVQFSTTVDCHLLIFLLGSQKCLLLGLCYEGPRGVQLGQQPSFLEGAGPDAEEGEGSQTATRTTAKRGTRGRPGPDGREGE